MVQRFRPEATWLLVLVLLAPPLWGYDEAGLEAALESPGRHHLLLRPDPDLEIPVTVLVGALHPPAERAEIRSDDAAG